MNTATLQCLVVLGPTATGKTRLAVALARRFNGEILSVDSRQVYRGLDLGTGKDRHEYGAGANRIPVHLVDVLAPIEQYDLHRFLDEARAVLADVAGRNCLPILAGGTPLYLNALLDRYEMPGAAATPERHRELAARSPEELCRILEREAPDLAARVDRTQKQRLVRAVEIARTRSGGQQSGPGPRLDPLLLGPYYARPTVHKLIRERLDQRLAQGLIREVEELHQAGLPWERLEYFGLEYRFVAHYLQGKLDRNEMRDRLLAAIRRFCRAQDVWFRTMERAGKVIHWIPNGNLETAAGLVQMFLAGRPLPPPALRLRDTLYGPQSRR